MTPLGGTYPYSYYKGVPPPPRGALCTTWREEAYVSNNSYLPSGSCNAFKASITADLFTRDKSSPKITRLARAVYVIAM